MKLRFPLPIRVPSILKWWYPSGYVWDKPTPEKVLYLTFDDGPIPEVTEWVLDTLSRKRNPNNSSLLATFFCIGDNVRKYPAVFKKILAENHSVGNHTYNHLKGWLTDNDTYLKNTHLSELELSKTAEKEGISPNFPLFRPPYGKIKKSQARTLQQQGYTIVMYRVICYDWDEHTTSEKCLEHIIKHTRSGDIIVFHDSVKAFKNLKYALPRAIDYFLEKGYRFEKLV